MLGLLEKYFAFTYVRLRSTAGEVFASGRQHSANDCSGDGLIRKKVNQSPADSHTMGSRSNSSRKQVG